jgi:hypothetical protein
VRTLRTLLLLLLSLSLPLYGSAALAVAPPCPMEMAAMDRPAMDSAEDAAYEGGDAALADCCADAAVRAATGKPCKAGQECQTGSVTLPPPAIGQALPADHGAPPRNALPPPTQGAADIWRPPAAS